MGESTREIAERIVGEHAFIIEHIEALIDRIDAALKAERERCATVAEDQGTEYERLGDYGIDQGYVRMVTAANEIAAAIRGEE